ncbi:MAG: hypothetical protein WAM53_04365 [Terrimicrobiaceae bacterium]
MPWYVVCDDDCPKWQRRDPTATIWTLSRRLDAPGWNTDGGADNYALTKGDAQELADAANAANVERSDRPRAKAKGALGGQLI